MRNLEDKFAAAAAIDGDVFLPNFTPLTPVDAILVGMEPSLGRWARTPAEAASRIAAGFRNFMWSLEDFILHYAARRVLCPVCGTYQITDVSKGAMTVAKANVDRQARYARWIALLREEVELIAKPHACIVALGREVGDLLNRHRFDRDVTAVMHYSAQAARYRHAAVEGRGREFGAFAETVSIEDIVATAHAVMDEHSVPAVLRAETIARLHRAKLSTSRKKLAFIYVDALARLSCSIHGRAPLLPNNRLQPAAAAR
jgi:hypothetical protein